MNEKKISCSGTKYNTKKQKSGTEHQPIIEKKWSIQNSINWQENHISPAYNISCALNTSIEEVPMLHGYMNQWYLNADAVLVACAGLRPSVKFHLPPTDMPIILCISTNVGRWNTRSWIFLVRHRKVTVYIRYISIIYVNISVQ